jgi:hypothetical protein
MVQCGDKNLVSNKQVVGSRVEHIVRAKPWATIIDKIGAISRKLQWTLTTGKKVEVKSPEMKPPKKKEQVLTHFLQLMSSLGVVILIRVPLHTQIQCQANLSDFAKTRVPPVPSAIAAVLTRRYIAAFQPPHIIRFHPFLLLCN